MAHNLVRALILPAVIMQIEQKYLVDENKALDMFYRSEVGRQFSVDDSGLYGQSANFIFSAFEGSINA